MSTFFKTRPVDQYNDTIYTMDKFKDEAKHNWLIDEDGYGHLSDGKEVSEIVIYPSNIYDPLFMGSLPTWANHVIWYNR